MAAVVPVLLRVSDDCAAFLSLVLTDDVYDLCDNMHLAIQRGWRCNFFGVHR